MSSEKSTERLLEAAIDTNLTRRSLVTKGSMAGLASVPLAAGLAAAGVCTTYGAAAAAMAQDDEEVPELDTEEIPPLAEEAQGIEYANVPELAFTGELRFNAQGYTPVKPTSTQPNPPAYLNRIIAEYQAVRPSVTIALQPPMSSGVDRATYLQTQATSGQMLDIEWHNGTGAINNLVDIGIFQPLDEYLDRPNHYIPAGQPGSERWGDVFDGSVIEQLKSRGANDGQLYYISGDYVGTGIFYNKTLFDEAGITEFPQTWDAFIAAHQTLQDAGVQPFGFHLSTNLLWWWFSKTLYTQFIGKEFDRLNVDGQVFRLSDLGNAVGWVTKTVHPENPAYRDVYRILKEWSAYFQSGYLAATEQDIYRNFVNGDCAMMWGGSWAVPQLSADPLIDFEWAMGIIPTVTAATSEFATDIPAPIEGCPCAAFSYLITSQQANGQMNDEKREAALDWLMFLTAPHNGGPMINDLGSFLPTLQGATALPSLVDLIAAPDRQPTIDGAEALTVEASDTFFRILQDFMGDEITLDEFLEQIQPPVDAAVEQKAGENNWDLDQYT